MLKSGKSGSSSKQSRRIVALLAASAVLAVAGVAIAVVGSGPSAPTGARGELSSKQLWFATSNHKRTSSTTTTRPRSSTTTTQHPTTTTTTQHPTTTTTTAAPATTTTTTGVTTPPSPPPPNVSGTRWQPTASATLEWQWEIAHPLSTSSNADLGLGASTYSGAPAGNPTVYDIDGFDNGAATVAALHARGAHVICYIDVGTWENWRPDASAFPAALLGSSNGWPGERWLDTSPAGPDYATLQAIMTARFQLCKSQGYDAVEPDNIDGAENSTGFSISLSQGDQYAQWVAAEVHALGMSVAQKNFEDQSAVLQPSFDFVVEEQCFQYDSCSSLAPYTAAHKAVLEVEYSDQGANPSSYCPTAIGQGFSSTEFDTALDAKVRVPCA